MFDTIREVTGCQKAKRRPLRFHNYQWGLGPSVPVHIEDGLAVQETTLGGPGSWWMYCTKCGRKAWQDES